MELRVGWQFRHISLLCQKDLSVDPVSSAYREEKNCNKTNICFAISAIRCMLHRNPMSSKLLQQQMFFLECNRFKLYMYNFSFKKVGVSLSSKCCLVRHGKTFWECLSIPLIPKYSSVTENSGLKLYRLTQNFRYNFTFKLICLKFNIVLCTPND